MIGKLLGHRKVQTTARYAHLARDSVKAAAERVAGSLAIDLDAPPNAPAVTKLAEDVDERTCVGRTSLRRRSGRTDPAICTFRQLPPEPRLRALSLAQGSVGTARHDRRLSRIEPQCCSPERHLPHGQSATDTPPTDEGGAPLLRPQREVWVHVSIACDEPEASTTEAVSWVVYNQDSSTGGVWGASPGPSYRVRYRITSSRVRPFITSIHIVRPR